jgi:DNA-binding transcriptional regulator YiaG
MTIKEICEKYGFTQTALAQRFNIPLRTVQDWHSGRRTPPEYVVNMMVELLDNGK